MALCVVLIRETFSAQKPEDRHSCLAHGCPAALISFLVFRWSLKSSCIINIHDHKDNSNDTLHRLGYVDVSLLHFFSISKQTDRSVSLARYMDFFEAQFVWIQQEDQLFV